MPDDFLSIIESRHCKRAFLDKTVPRELLEEVLRAAAHAPSTRNTQLWRVAVLTGRSRDELARRLLLDFDSGAPIKPDYVNRPVELDPVTQERAQQNSVGLFALKGIARDDQAARRAHLRDNYRFYGAPVELIYHLGADAPPGTFLEMGFFLQNVMLGLVARGLASCPQFSVAAYSDTIREHLGFGPDQLIVCGMAVGYMDPSAPVNQYIPERAPLEDYARWFED